MDAGALDPELTLKATPPRTPRHLLVRERLALAHPRWNDRRVLALQAPAGYGKTTLLLQWRREALQQGALFLWLTLDDRDQPDRLVRALQTALAVGGGAALGLRAPELLRTEAAGPMEPLTAWLAQVALLATEVLLVLDDLHLAPGASTACLRYLLLNAPANLTVLAATQGVLPASAAHAVADGRLGVIGAGDLALEQDESAQLVRSHLGARADAATCLRVHELAAGWPLGVRILATSGREGGEPRGAIEAQGRAGFEAWLQRFVLEAMDAGDVDFLLRVSIATPLSPGLCAAITGRADSAAVLERLCAATPLFDQLLSGEWVRMQGLARALLLRRCEAELPLDERTGLHRRAAEWLAAHGMPEPAAHHALAAHMRAWSYDLLEQGLPAVLGRGDLERALGWVEAIPAAELLQRPFAAIVAASALSYRPGDEALREELLRGALARAAESPLRREAAAVMLQAALAHDDGARVAQLVAQWRPERGQGCPVLDLQLTAAESLDCIYRGEPAQARHLWSALVLPSDRPVATMAGYLRASALAYSHLWEARPAEAAQAILPVLQELEAALGRRSVLATACATLPALARCDQGRAEEAAGLLADRLDVLERTQMFRPVCIGFVVAARLAAAQGDEARALGLLERLAFLGALHRTPRYAIESLAEQVRLHARQGRTQKCAAALGNLEALCGRPDVQANRAGEDYRRVLLALARTQACMAAGDHEPALSHAGAGQALATRLRLERPRLQLQLLAALALRRTGRPGAEAMAAEAASLAKAYGLAGLLRDAHPDAGDLLKLEPPRVLEPSPAPEPPAKVADTSLLTPRERDVLQCLAAGLANKRIAASLAIGEETVKWHVKNLLNKLGGANRSHVVDRARQLGVLA